MRFRQLDSGPQEFSLSDEQSHTGSSEGSITMRTAVVHLFTYSETKQHVNKAVSLNLCKLILSPKPWSWPEVLSFIYMYHLYMECLFIIFPQPKALLPLPDIYMYSDVRMMLLCHTITRWEGLLQKSGKCQNRPKLKALGEKVYSMSCCNHFFFFLKKKAFFVSGSTKELHRKKLNCFCTCYRSRTNHKPTKKLRKHGSLVKWKPHAKNQLL